MAVNERKVFQLMQQFGVDRKTATQAMKSVGGNNYKAAARTVQGFQETKNNTAAIQAAGITNYNSINDYRQVQAVANNPAPRPSPQPAPSPQADPAPSSGGGGGGGGGGYSAPAQPTFDWESWNAEMMAQQAAVMAQMDAMNSEFMRQQQEWLSQQEAQVNRLRSAINVGSASPDAAQVKRKKRKRSSSIAARGVTNTGLGIASGAAAGVAGSGLSIGGA